MSVFKGQAGDSPHLPALIVLAPPECGPFIAALDPTITPDGLTVQAIIVQRHVSLGTELRVLNKEFEFLGLTVTTLEAFDPPVHQRDVLRAVTFPFTGGQHDSTHWR